MKYKFIKTLKTESGGCKFISSFFVTNHGTSRWRIVAFFDDIIIEMVEGNANHAFGFSEMEEAHRAFERETWDWVELSHVQKYVCREK